MYIRYTISMLYDRIRKIQDMEGLLLNPVEVLVESQDIKNVIRKLNIAHGIP